MKGHGGSILIVGGLLLCVGYALDPVCSLVPLEKVACVGTMGAGCAMVAAGFLQLYWDRYDGR